MFIIANLISIFTYEKVLHLSGMSSLCVYVDDATKQMDVTAFFKAGPLFYTISVLCSYDSLFLSFLYYPYHIFVVSVPSVMDQQSSIMNKSIQTFRYLDLYCIIFIL
ncbi:hypothetical protein SPOG_05616 [Schizosaccharomyces cryophilus OY26]|uniref:Uncharacterized protein n=1 Tax=Schizosaccharomyces cryophilus (strain OY26 / ATCC MYA-4695 / CBS 11777 / NBRC 106824 / NRRL Y48691) TaxID=653667 RepID=S9W6J6_SCHCR|nr:uncharacterized protein SPOG_05616 [Schizosaccharomyces cryophilus OY26]EPY53450.1 hypothetical protein SPOG_05616 [Schizosaccharomyces cryophilus OY26]